MSEIKTHARAVADVIEGCIVASVEIARTPDRVFQALSTREIVDWWVNPGVFDTREWSGDVRVGGRWSASGIARGAPYTLEGEFLEVDPPRRLVQTFRALWSEDVKREGTSRVTWEIEPVGDSCRLTVTHDQLREGANAEDGENHRRRNEKQRVARLSLHEHGQAEVADEQAK